MGATVHSHMAVESVCRKNFSPSPSKVKFVLGGKGIFMQNTQDPGNKQKTLTDHDGLLPAHQEQSLKNRKCHTMQGTQSWCSVMT